MADLVSLQEARLYCKSEPEDDPQLALTLEEATELIVERIAASQLDADKAADVRAWTMQTVPRRVAAAIKFQTREMLRFRGDDDASVMPRWDMGSLHPGVERLIRQLIDLPIA